MWSSIIQSLNQEFKEFKEYEEFKEEDREGTLHNFVFLNRETEHDEIK